MVLNATANAGQGAMRVTYGSDVLGYIDPDGVTVSTDGHQFVPLLTDKYGKTPLDQFDINIESVIIKFNELEINHAMRLLLMPFANEQDGGGTDLRMQEGALPSGSSASKHKALNLHPWRLGDANKSLDWDFHLCLLQIKGDQQFGSENVQMFPVEGACILDGSKTLGNQLYEIGGVTS